MHLHPKANATCGQPSALPRVAGTTVLVVGWQTGATGTTLERNNRFWAHRAYPLSAEKMVVVIVTLLALCLVAEHVQRDALIESYTQVVGDWRDGDRLDSPAYYYFLHLLYRRLAAHIRPSADDGIAVSETPCAEVQHQAELGLVSAIHALWVFALQRSRAPDLFAETETQHRPRGGSAHEAPTFGSHQ